MPLTPNAVSLEASDIAARYPYLSLHYANPGNDGINETKALRMAANWTVTNGAARSASATFTGGVANGPCAYAGLWSSQSGGIFGGSTPLIGDQVFDSSGNYTVSSLTVYGSSTDSSS